MTIVVSGNLGTTFAVRCRLSSNDEGSSLGVECVVVDMELLLQSARAATADAAEDDCGNEDDSDKHDHSDQPALHGTVAVCRVTVDPVAGPACALNIKTAAHEWAEVIKVVVISVAGRGRRHEEYRAESC